MSLDCTTNQLVSTYHDVCKSQENRNDIHVTFNDISKACDKVWHKGLIYKPKSIGCYGSILKW